ncbi:hypothetical protein C0995_009497 [Termitomyces sp. Mi166|nr:hypothetical protein C0995_009497 [Termitomyces sp. Mi166\
MSLCGSSSSGPGFGRKPIQRKVVVCGDGACGTCPLISRDQTPTRSPAGKTSLLNVFTRGFFTQVYEPTVFENYVQDILVDDQVVELSLWDTAEKSNEELFPSSAGQEEFDRLRSLSYAETHVIMICFSDETQWIDEILEYCPGVKLVLVALKCDLRDDRGVRERLQRYGTHPVEYEEGLAVARRIRASRYLECSSKHNRGVTEVFYEAARVALSTRTRNGRDGGCIAM